MLSEIFERLRSPSDSIEQGGQAGQEGAALALLDEACRAEGCPEALGRFLEARAHLIALGGGSALASLARASTDPSIAGEGSRLPGGYLRACSPFELPDQARTLLAAEETPRVSAMVVGPGGMVTAGHVSGAVITWDSSSGRRARQLHALGGGMIEALALDPSGKTLLVGVYNGRKGELGFAADAETGARLSTFEGLTGQPSALAFADEGKLAVVAQYPSFQVFDTATWKRGPSGWGGEFKPYVRAICVLPDQRTALLVGPSLSLVDLATGRVLQPETPLRPDDVWSGAVLQDGATALLGLSDGRVQVWDIAGWARGQTYGIHDDVILSVSLLPCGKRALSGSWDRTVRLWDVATGEVLRVFEGHAGWVTNVAPLGERQAVSASHDGSIKVWDLPAAPGEPAAAKRKRPKAAAVDLRRHRASVGQVLLDDRGALAASIGAHEYGRKRGSRSNDDQRIRIWDTETGACLRVIGPHRKQITAMVLHPDGDVLVTGLATGSLEVLSTSTGERLRALEGHKKAARPAFFVPLSRTLVSVGDDQVVRVWDVDTGACTAELRGHTMQVSEARCLASGARVVSCGTREGSATWKLWDLGRGEPLGVLPLGGGVSLHADPAWSHAVIEEPSGVLRVWSNLRSHKVEEQPLLLPGMLGAGLAAGVGRWAPWSGGVQVRDEGLGEVIFRQPAAAYPAYGRRVLLDGRLLVVARLGERALDVWDVERGERSACFVFDAQLTALAGSRSGRIATGDSGGWVRFFDHVR